MDRKKHLEFTRGQRIRTAEKNSARKISRNHFAVSRKVMWNLFPAQKTTRLRRIAHELWAEGPHFARSWLS
jgi:hypothetical protein